ncbi:hypothetical protein [Rubrivivax gelatinosus]|uniref:Uncharacterized protein n=1 Tax=Rubrivivax gelatinosus TaxID=28068 RepID=A0ABS1E2M9_RUBGE|nr:hypothetical protein [Rubrivivax gelatinosus]MBK1715834.1 hypothetical protein [Rubrivivax gelatinosus]
MPFDLVWPEGHARLDLPAAGASAVDAALALAPVLPALALLQDWIGAPLHDLRPAADAPWPAAALTLAWGEGGRLALPWRLLPWGRTPPAALPLHHWPCWPARLLLQALPAARLPARERVPGALLLLPASFAGADCALELHAPAGGLPLPRLGGVVWQPQAGSLQLAAARPLADSGDVGARVWLEQTLEVDARAWFGGWPQPLELAAGAARLEIDGRPCAEGPLLPAGRGWGLRLQRLAAVSEPLAWT